MNRVSGEELIAAGTGYRDRDVAPGGPRDKVAIHAIHAWLIERRGDRRDAVANIDACHDRRRVIGSEMSSHALGVRGLVQCRAFVAEADRERLPRVPRPSSSRRRGWTSRPRHSGTPPAAHRSSCSRADCSTFRDRVDLIGIRSSRSPASRSRLTTRTARCAYGLARRSADVPAAACGRHAASCEAAPDPYVSSIRNAAGSMAGITSPLARSA
jgi:hypothetical protein